MLSPPRHTQMGPGGGSSASAHAGCAPPDAERLDIGPGTIGNEPEDPRASPGHLNQEESMMDTTHADTGLSRASPEAVSNALHLSTEALTRLRELLLEERSVQVDQATEQARTVAELKTDPTTSIGQFEVDWELAEVMVGWSQEAIEDIENALARIDAGTYGHCEQCGAAIPLERLEAIPHTRFCVRCQGRRDAMR